MSTQRLNDMPEVDDSNLDLERLELEKKKLQLEEKKQSDFVKQFDREIALKQVLQSESSKQYTLPIWTAAFTAIIGIATAGYNAFQNIQIEKSKAQSALILKLSEIRDEKELSRTLLFYSKSNLLDLPSECQTYLAVKADLKEGQPLLPVAPPPQNDPSSAFSEQQAGFQSIIDGNLNDAIQHLMKAESMQQGFGCSFDLLNSVRKQAGSSTPDSINALRNSLEKNFYGYLNNAQLAKLKEVNRGK